MSVTEQQIEISTAPDGISEQQQTCSPRRTLRETMGQQEILINAFRQQILRLQNQAIEQNEKYKQLQKHYADSLATIETLQQKIETLRQNNQSIMHTFEVFQREFVKRDYKNLMKVKSETEKVEGPYFLQLIRNMKSKFSPLQLNQKPGELHDEQKSQLSQYYGYFFNEELDERESEMYNDLNNQQIFDSGMRSKLKSFGRKHCFHQKYRPCFWYSALENTLRITEPLYEMYLNKLEASKAEQKIEDKISLIDRDLNRMDFKLDEDKSSTMKLSIKKCLELFEMYRPDIGYVQGMSYLAWMIHIRLENYRAFTCFSNLILCDSFVHSLYCFKEPRIRRIKDFYEKCMEDKKSKLLKHMKALEVQCELFIIEWAYTMFTRAFNLRITSKIWDLWFSEGYTVFFKSVLVIMDFLQDEILKMNENDKIVEFIRAQTHKIDEIELIKSLKKQKLSQQLFL